MGRDFARKGRRRTRTKKSKSNGRWIWLLTGTFLGGLASALVFFKLELGPATFAQFMPTPTAAPVVAVAEKETSRAPRFDFYSLLPELEVAVPAPASAPIAAAEQLAEKAVPQDAIYRLQLASFKSFEEADRLKAEMALLGIELEIETVTLAAGETWYRVRSTPYTNRQSAESARAALQAQAIKSLLLEEKS